KKVLEIILEGNILLDDHAIIINNFFEEKQISLYRLVSHYVAKILEMASTYWFNNNYIRNKNKEVNADINYEELKSYYYTFILVQSEMLFIIAHAYNIRTKDCSVHIPKTNLIKSIKYLTKPLSIYYLKICKIIHNYQSCEIHPIKRVFRGIPNSIWQDIYSHLDLTSQKIQLAYKQITSILESIDFQDEKDHNNLELIESIMERMNEAYKQIENARNFAEFSSLLIAKIQHKPINNLDTNESEPLLAMNTDEKIVIINNDLEIEDEVFEEYIKEEYLKPLCENSDISILQNFKLDKLLAKNFMTELKEALTEKQKSMTERELKALKRMYNKILKLSTSALSESLSPTPPPTLPPPPPPLPPPRVLKDAISTNNYIEKNKLQKNKCTPIPLPRVKMLKSEDIIPNVQKFSINQSIQDFKFPIFTEETFFGSGENSEEDDLKNNNEDNEVH
ncbi:PREDICTED: uncharacterized protein LOC105365359, partial [Ceratosolen solmsi marchali]|uniref:Uncharacterized protein LOC105365359 n=1 Tax=Ceratosolen solmsi marchali TaxID=326594 RepID=A0AAJ6YPF3_9HYME